MEIMIDKIAKADRSEIYLIFSAALQRKRELYPDWEMIFISMPKEDNQERKDTINWITNMLRKEQEDN